MDLRTFVRIMWTRRGIVAAAVLICLVGAAAATIIPPSQYQASSKIFITVSDASSATDKFNATQASQLRLSSYAQIAGGREVASRAIDQLGLDMSPLVLVESTNVDYTPESQIFELTVTDTDSRLAVDLVNAMSDQFTKLVGELEATTTGEQPGETGQQTPVTMQATVIERPTLPDSPSSPSPTRNFAIGLLAGLLLGILLALVRDATDHTVRTREGLVEASDQPVVGVLPKGPPADEGAKLVFGRDHASTEAYRGLRSRLQHMTTEQSRVLMVTGPAGGEGTTTVSLNLALALAEINAKVLLVEGNLRQAELAEMTGVDAEPGLSDVLRNVSIVERAVAQTQDRRLSVLPSGSPHPSPGELLSAGDLESVVGELRGRFDFVVIDGPPVLPAADSGILAPRSDGVLLVVRCGTSNADDVSRAVEILQDTGSPLIGTLLTNAKVS